jgi:hypothetical protein
VNGIGFKHSGFIDQLTTAGKTEIAKEGLTWQDASSIRQNLIAADLSESQATSFARLYQLASTQTPASVEFQTYQTALTAYKNTPGDAEKKLALFDATCKLVESEGKLLDGNAITDAGFKSALANSCLNTVEALNVLSGKDGFTPTDNAAVTSWPQNALQSFQKFATLAKLAKRNIHARTCTMDEAIAMAKKDPSLKIISSKLENGKLVFCELVLDAEKNALVPKKDAGTDQPAWQSSKQFAQTFQPTSGETPVTIIRENQPMNEGIANALKDHITTEAHKTTGNQTIWDAFCKLAEEKSELGADNWENALSEDIQNDDDTKVRFNEILAQEIAEKSRNPTA